MGGAVFIYAKFTDSDREIGYTQKQKTLLRRIYVFTS